MNKKKVMVALFIMAVAVYSLPSNAFFWDKKKEEKMEQTIKNGNSEENVEVPDSLINGSSEEKLKQIENGQKNKDYPNFTMKSCMDNCGLDRKVVAECHRKNRVDGTNVKCITNEQKQCLISCADEKNRMFDMQAHKKCFNDCKINQAALIECRKEYKEKGLDPSNKCLPSLKQECLKECYAN